MPTYEYACKSCDEHLEVAQSFKDAALTECPSCGGPLRKVFGNIGIAFKGSGFYRNDSRSEPKTSSAAKGSEAKTDGAAAKEGTGGKESSTSTKESSTTKEGSGSKGSASTASASSSSGPKVAAAS